MHKIIQYSLLTCTTSRARCEKIIQNLNLNIKEGVKSEVYDCHFETGHAVLYK